jgi:hypothetical protein
MTMTAEERKEAQRKANRRYIARHREAHLAYHRAYYAANKDAVLAQRKTLYASNSGILKARSKAYREANPEAVQAYSAARYAANSAAAKAQSKAWRDANVPAGSARSSWRCAKDRCTRANHDKYKYYGGRGITMCERWMSFANFLADVGERPSQKHTLHRLHNDRSYEPGNCVWSTDHKERHLTRFLTSVQRRALFKSIPAA